MAVFVLFVVGAMAALSIDVTTMYTARSEAQLAVDSAALAGARVLANSGATSDPNSATDNLMTLAQQLAVTVATQVAEQNKIGGNVVLGPNLTPAISFGGSWFNPTITVNVKISNLPTFFARIWGRTTLAVAASATAEAYNPSGAYNGPLGQTGTPVAPLCVKPWLLPNMDPSNSGKPIFDPTSGAITPTSNLLGWSSLQSGVTMSLSCPNGNCSTLLPPAPWQYYPGNNDATSFPEPTFSLPSCTRMGAPTAYEYSIAGCIQTPISCTSNGVNIDMANNRRLNRDTAEAVNCLTNAADGGDTVATTAPPTQAIEFVAGAGSPAAVATPALIGKYVMVSDSLVTVPVFNSTAAAPTNPVTIIGFVQLFLNPDGNPAPNNGPTSGNVKTTVVNLVGCGTSATGTPIILGNGVSPVAVRLITPSS